MSRKRKLEEVDGISRNEVAPGITLNDAVADALKTHQIEGIRFLWKHLSSGRGCLLAHSMGLGKSAQAIIAINLLMKHSGTKTVLLVTPKSTLPGWTAEVPLWTKKAGFPALKMTVIGDDAWQARSENVRKWHKTGGVLAMSYELYGNMVGAYKKDRRPKELEDMRKFLQHPGADLVVCDEGHTIRNQQSGISQSLNMIRTPLRVMLTGTPMQNCLEELWGMIEFVHPGYFPRRDFVTYFEQPIREGQRSTSTHTAIQKMRQRAYILQQELNSFVHRRDQSILIQELPAKNEYVLVCPQNDFQAGLHKRFRAWYMKRAHLIKGGHNTLLYTHVLNKVSGHTDMLKATIEEILSGDRASSEQGWASDLSWAEGVIVNAESYRPMLLSRSPKMMTLMYMIEYCIENKEKLLIFSQWTMSLELILKFTSVLAPSVDVWSLTGDMPQVKRKLAIEGFQKHGGPCIFLISTTAGGMGINLNTAHRAVLFDVAFNPAVDQQAVFRCYRYGLKHPVTIYRLVTHNMPETAVYQACVRKEWLGKKVVDSAAPSRAHIQGQHLHSSNLYADPSVQDPETTGENAKLWSGEKRRALRRDPLLAHVERKMAGRGLPLGRVFRHESLLIDDGDEAGFQESRAYHIYKAEGGNRALNTIIDKDVGLLASSVPESHCDPKRKEEEDEKMFLDFIDTSAPLPLDILDDLSQSSDDDTGFVPELD
ncbi:Protein CHROMATIN REMODELING 20 [Diplonema papillatum]|nr:Protein CHROMATIN REMODELING 20 [Diplonema papillatum]